MIAAALLAGAIAYNFDDYFPRGTEQKRKNMVQYAIFQSANPAFDFTFEYPKVKWSPEETQGRIEKYDTVRLKGPVDLEKKFMTLISVTVKLEETGKTAADLLEEYIKMISGGPKFRVLSKKRIEVGGERASSGLFEHEARLPMDSLDAAPVMVDEQTVFWVRNGRSYRITFRVLAAQQKTNLPVFEHVLRTFKFKK